MILLQISLTILIVLVGVALVVQGRDLLADHRDRKAERLDHELTEREVQQHIYPDGNVHILTPDKTEDE